MKHFDKAVYAPMNDHIELQVWGGLTDGKRATLYGLVDKVLICQIQPNIVAF